MLSTPGRFLLALLLAPLVLALLPGILLVHLVGLGNSSFSDVDLEALERELAEEEGQGGPL